MGTGGGVLEVGRSRVGRRRAFGLVEMEPVEDGEVEVVVIVVGCGGSVGERKTRTLGCCRCRYS